MSDGREYAEFRAAHARRASKRKGERMSGDEMYQGKGSLTGATMLKHVRYISDQELSEAAQYPDSVRTVSGRRVRDAARAEIKRRKEEGNG